MDGSDKIAIASTQLRWPNGLTYDATTQRIYWSDAQHNRIEYFDTITKERKVLLQDTVFHPYSMTVFEDTLYWTDWQTLSLDSCDKFTGRNQTIVLREDQEMMGVHVFHPVRTPKMNSPCWSEACTHMCLLAPRKKYTCACPPHMTLAKDERTCVANSTDFLLVGVQKSIKKVYPESIGRDVLFDILMPHHMLVGDYSYDQKHGVLYVFDINKYVISMVNVTNGQSRVLISNHIDSASGLTYDPVSNNLYWLEVNKGVVMVSAEGMILFDHN